MDRLSPPDYDAHLQVQGIRTHVRVQGEGPALLLLGGFWGELAVWQRLTPYLPGFRVITFDAPGIGGTESPPHPMSLSALSRFALAVLDGVGHRHAHVLGISFGGVVAQQVAVIAPQRVDRLVLVSTSAGMLDLPSVPGALLRLGWSLTTARRGVAAGALFGGRVRDDPNLLERLHMTPPSSVKAQLYRLAGLAGWYEMPWSVRRPTLVLTGDDDPLIPVSNGQVLAALINGARLVVVPGGGHLMLFDSQDEVGPIVADFLVSPADGAGQRDREALAEPLPRRLGRP